MNLLLTPTEKRVLDALLENGASNIDLAVMCGMSQETVKMHLTAIRDKRGYGTKLELAVNELHKRYMNGDNR